MQVNKDHYLILQCFNSSVSHTVRLIDIKVQRNKSE